MASVHPSNSPACRSTSQRAPNSAVSSSSAVNASTMSRRGRRPLRAHSAASAISTASAFFMSTAPRPHSTPSRISPENGCTDQAAGSAGTTSRCPCSSRAPSSWAPSGWAPVRVRSGAADPRHHVRPARRRLEQHRLEPRLGQPRRHVLRGRPLLRVPAAPVGRVDPDQVGREPRRVGAGRGHPGPSAGSASPAVGRGAPARPRGTRRRSAAWSPRRAPPTSAPGPPRRWRRRTRAAGTRRSIRRRPARRPRRHRPVDRLIATSRPRCGKMKLSRCTSPSRQITCRSARNSPSRVKVDSNQPVAPPGNASRTASERSATAPPASSATGSASAPVTDGRLITCPSPAPSSRRQSIA